NWEFVCLLVPGDTVRSILCDLECKPVLPDLPRRVLADSGMAERLKTLHRQLSNDGDLLAKQSITFEVIGDFFRRYSTLRFRPGRVKAEKDRVRHARDLLHERFAESMPLARLAADAGLSPYYFLRTFRATVGMTPHAYLNQVRVLEAKRRLAEGASPAETALACG